MKVTVAKEPDLLRISFACDNLDAFTPANTVWFRFDRPVRLESTRLALIAYVLCADILGNVFSIEGIKIPAHIASAISQNFLGEEIFIDAVNNIAEKVLPIRHYSRLVMESTGKKSRRWGDGEDSSASPQPSELGVRRTALGYAFRSADLKSRLGVSTNVDYHASVCCANPMFASVATMFLIAFDSLGVTDFDLPSSLVLDKGTHNFISCIREAGGNVRIVE
jgi:hypothetical protein